VEKYKTLVRKRSSARNARVARTLLILGLAFASGLEAADFDWNLPKGFPRPAVPKDNPMSAVKVELGRFLFYDKRMSVNGKESCGSCHRQELAFTDGRARAEGTTGETHPRSSMSLVNVAYAAYLTWANGTMTSLEEQALTPMLGEVPIELGLKGHEGDFLAAAKHTAVYRRLFPAAFPGESDPYMLKNVTRAIATFERSIVSVRSPYDRYRYGGDPSAISPAAKRGEIVFASGERGGCFECHGGWNFSGSIRFDAPGGSERETEPGGSFFNTGVSLYAAPNRGLYEQTQKDEDLGRFKVPSLRNIVVTAPYMHDGSMATLDEVIDHYSAGGMYDHPNKSRMVHERSLTPDDRSDLIEFLKTLTDQEMLHDARWSDPWIQPKAAALAR
jgi:cytochrome c peroxidase